MPRINAAKWCSLIVPCISHAIAAGFYMEANSQDQPSGTAQNQRNALFRVLNRMRASHGDRRACCNLKQARMTTVSQEIKSI